MPSFTGESFNAQNSCFTDPVASKRCLDELTIGILGAGEIGKASAKLFKVKTTKPGLVSSLQSFFSGIWHQSPWLRPEPSTQKSQ